MPKKPKVFFRADGDTSIGLGHVIRSLALAEMLASNFECNFIIKIPSQDLKNEIESVCDSIIEIGSFEEVKEEANFVRSLLSNQDICVLDGYNFNTEYQIIIKSSNAKLVCIDDIHAYHFVTDAIINHAGGILKNAYSYEGEPKFCLGPKYALLRKPFRKAAQIDQKSSSQNDILICFGGADPKNDTLSTLQICVNLRLDYHYHIILGGAYIYTKVLDDFLNVNKLSCTIYTNLDAQSMVAVMTKCAIAVTSPSSISYEYLSVGGTLYLKIIADNQQSMYSYMISEKLAYDFAFLGKGEISKLETNHQRNTFDGQQSKRLIHLFYSLKVSIRKANLADAMTYFNWANDPRVRAQSFSKEIIPFEKHKHWFERRIPHPKHVFFIYHLNEIPVGQIRFDINENVALLNYSVDKNFRGRGFGNIFFEKGINEFKSYFSNDFTIIGFVKKQNIPSIRIFHNFDFKEEDSEEYPDSYKYTLTCKV